MRRTRNQLDLAAGTEQPPIAAAPVDEERAYLDARQEHAAQLLKLARRARRLKRHAVYHRWGSRSSSHLDGLAQICEVVSEMIGNRRFL